MYRDGPRASAAGRPRRRGSETSADNQHDKRAVRAGARRATSEHAKAYRIARTSALVRRMRSHRAFDFSKLHGKN
ncbi:hypothetical protein EVAR_75664_1 [Eumeta japonica]|uniref:Uncharacterized protein n=1 Tax=Eumeta variegata TaxID=151549 RepID=A0A4C1U046_EUMVA|nr:hypothetical protein EVAR_75664_1 [Eumeta japonica]